MSLAKIHQVDKSRQDQGECGRCHVALPAGTAYRWFVVGFRSKNKRKRCMKSGCTPKMSERESSSLSEIYALQEDWESAQAAGFESLDELQGAWETLTEGYRQYAEDRRAAAEAWEHGNSQLEEQADAAEQAADALESHQLGDTPPEPEEYMTQEGYLDALTSYITEQADEAGEILAGVEI